MKITLKKVNLDSDLELLYAWRSNPLIYKNFLLQSEPLIWDNHLKFWENSIGRLDFMVLFDERRIGHLSFKNICNKTYEVGIMIGEVGLWGKGLGKKILAEAIDISMKFGWDSLEANILYSNQKSIRLFESAGFIMVKSFVSKKVLWNNYSYNLHEVI